MHDVTRNLLKSGIDAHPDFTWLEKLFPGPPPGYPLCEFNP